MPRHDGNSGKKKKKRYKSFKHQTKENDPEEELELVVSTQTTDQNRRPSAGSSAVHKKIFREEADHDRLVTAGLRKACIGAGLLKDDPANIQRVGELRKRAAHNLHLRREAGLEKFNPT